MQTCALPIGNHRDGNGFYDHIDRFGRTVDHLGYDYGASADAVRIKHGYDRAGNRLWLFFNTDPTSRGGCFLT